MQKIILASEVTFPWEPARIYTTHTYREIGFYSVWSCPIITKYIDQIDRILKKSLRNHMFGGKKGGS